METALKQPGEQFAMIAPAALVDSVEADCGESAAQWAEYGATGMAFSGLKTIFPQQFAANDLPQK